MGYVYLVIFIVLFLALLFLLCGCLYFFFKKRKLGVDRRKRLVLTVPPGSEVERLGLGGLWWTGKGGPGPGSLSDDALLSHDYMLSSGQPGITHFLCLCRSCWERSLFEGRGGLSVSTESSQGSGPTPSPPHQSHHLYRQVGRLWDTFPAI